MPRVWSDSELEEAFTQGGCGAFAVHLAWRLQSQGTYCQIAVLSNPHGEDFSEEYDFEFTHAVVSVEDGYIDIYGHAATYQESMDRLGVPKALLSGLWEPDEFEAELCGDGEQPLSGGNPRLAKMIEQALTADPGKFRLSRPVQAPRP